ncbi:MAG: hypothetical protein H7Y43_18135 [Akkermansiaceae bacterium]|nr:hypothetical protein [Verrucomicrobiales bacterium]
MNANYRRVPTRFGPETRFELRPTPAVPFRATQETELERLKNRLLLEALNTLTKPVLNGDLRRAANEAAALAWVTPFPLLVFPTLFEEKAETAMLQAARQASVRQRSLELLAV